jgi:hypothetical protein
MADYTTLLRDHVTLKCRSIDRIFLQAYVPKLQTVGMVCRFLRWQRKFKIPSSAAFGKIGPDPGQAPPGWRALPRRLVARASNSGTASMYQ